MPSNHLHAKLEVPVWKIDCFHSYIFLSVFWGMPGAPWSQKTHSHLPANITVKFRERTSSLQHLRVPVYCLHNDTWAVPNSESTQVPLYWTAAVKHHALVFRHIPYTAAPITACLQPHCYLWEEEMTAHDFMSSEGSDKSNSNISREAFVLKLASNCWADVPAKEHDYQWGRDVAQQIGTKGDIKTIVLAKRTLRQNQFFQLII